MNEFRFIAQDEGLDTDGGSPLADLEEEDEEEEDEEEGASEEKADDLGA